MTVIRNGESESIINQVQVLIAKASPANEAELITGFAQRFLAASAIEDLRDFPIPDLCAMILSQWQFSYQREPGLFR